MMADCDLKEQIRLNKVPILSLSLEMTIFMDKLDSSSLCSGIKSRIVGLTTLVYFGISISEVAETKTRLLILANLAMIKDICSWKPNCKDLSNSSKINVWILSVRK